MTYLDYNCEYRCINRFAFNDSGMFPAVSIKLSLYIHEDTYIRCKWNRFVAPQSQHRPDCLRSRVLPVRRARCHDVIVSLKEGEIGWDTLISRKILISYKCNISWIWRLLQRYFKSSCNSCTWIWLTLLFTLQGWQHIIAPKGSKDM